MKILKNYKFLFLSLALGFFFFMPDDVFALEIQAYDSSGNLAYKSNASLPEVAQDCSFVGDIKGFTIFFHDQYDFYTNYNYEIKVDVILYTKVQNGVVDLGNPVFCAGGSCPPLNITSYSYGPWKGPTDAFCGIGGYTEPVKYSATFTTTLNGSRGYISWNFLHPITGLQAIVLNDYEITNLSDGTGAIINNSANSIIKNDKENTDKIIQNENKNHEESEKTRKGILETLKNVPNLIIDGIKGLFIPEDMSFLENFRDSLVDKLGFIAEVPLAVLDFILNLLTASWEEFNSITLPSIDIFGYKFWNETEISLQPAIDIFKPYLWVTDILCVVLCVNTLRKWYEGFAAGGGHQ